MAITKELEEEGEIIDMAAWVSRAALEAGGQGVVGHSFDPLVNAQPDEYATVIHSTL